MKIRFELNRFTHGKFLLGEHGLDQERRDRIFGLIAGLTFVWANFFFGETKQNFVKLRSAG